MSAFPLKAETPPLKSDVGFVPIVDTLKPLDHLVAISDKSGMRLILSRGALNGLYGMAQRDRQRMLAKLEAFAAEPFAPHPWATRLQGEDRVRIRQGDWRGVLLIVRDQDTVVLERVAHRREVYR